MSLCRMWRPIKVLSGSILVLLSGKGGAQASQAWTCGLDKRVTGDDVERPWLRMARARSGDSIARAKSYQNEELALAIEQLRMRVPEQPWLIPVRFDDCQIPDRDIGGGRTLNSIQRVDLFGTDFDNRAARLVAQIRLTAGPEPPLVTTGVEHRRAQRPTPVRLPTSFMAGLTEKQRAMLAGINKPGLTTLRDYIVAGEAIAVLGPGVSAPLYPGPADAARELIDEAAPDLTESEKATFRQLADDRPEDVVEMLRSRIGERRYWRFMDCVFSARADPASGRTWTPAQELICRCTFKGIVTTNCDPGIVTVRNRVRPDLATTEFTTSVDGDQLDRWRTGDIFGQELPVLYAHGVAADRESIVFAKRDYPRAYAGKLSGVLGDLVDSEHLHLIWIGFNGQGINATLQMIAEGYGSSIDLSAPPRHVMIMPWDPSGDENDPGILTEQARMRFGAQLVLYPGARGDRSALLTLLGELADPRFPAVADLPERAPAGQLAGSGAESARIPAKWVGMSGETDIFAGRDEELMRLDRWVADPEVRLIAVTAMAGAGKTSLVTHWLDQQGRAVKERATGIFGWSFYADPSPEHWAAELLTWAASTFGVPATHGMEPADAVFELLRRLRVLLVLDGLEAVQQNSSQRDVDRLLSGSLRDLITRVCQRRHRGMVVLTSRFAFADLRPFDGAQAQIMDLTPLLPADSADILAVAGGDWLEHEERLELANGVGCHALSLQAMASGLARHPLPDDLRELREQLAEDILLDTRQPGSAILLEATHRPRTPSARRHRPLRASCARRGDSRCC